MRLNSESDVAALLGLLTKSFHGGKYSELQLRSISNHLKRLTFAEGERMIEQFAMHGNQTPAPIKIVEQVNEIIKRRIASMGVAEEPKREPDCLKCFETGLVFIIHGEAVTLMRCVCSHGDKSNEPMPQAHVGTRLCPFPLDKFQPTKAERANSDMAQWPTVQWWKTAKEVAREYWANVGPA